MNELLPSDKLGKDHREGERTFTIGQLAQEFSITTRTIRFYESLGLISPDRKGANRIYTARDRARLSLILRGKNLGFSLDDISEYISLYDADPEQITQTRHLLEKVETTITDLDQKRADIERTLTELRDIRTRCVDHLDQKGRAQKG